MVLMMREYAEEGGGGGEGGVGRIPRSYLCIVGTHSPGFTRHATRMKPFRGGTVLNTMSRDETESGQQLDQLAQLDQPDHLDQLDQLDLLVDY